MVIGLQNKQFQLPNYYSISSKARKFGFNREFQELLELYWEDFQWLFCNHLPKANDNDILMMLLVFKDFISEQTK